MQFKFSKALLPFLCLIVTVLFIGAVPVSVPSGISVVQAMLVKSKTIHTMKYTMKKEERIKGKMMMQQSLVKLICNPLNVYLKQQLPKSGLEVLYVHGKNNNHAVVNTNGFPWVNLNLDPKGSIMRENQHHTIYDSGYPHLMSILEHLTTKYASNVEGLVVNNGTVHWNGKECWSISFSNPNFKYYKHTLKKGETILGIAAKEKLSEYMILEINKGIDSYTDVSVGQTINLPNDYSNRLELFIDKKENIPLVIKVNDDKGLYELYEYSNITVNPTFSGNEFSKEFPEYNF